jgi:phosphoribosylanthranilate isomerase
MWVKICGNTNLEDAMLAAELGADAIGFVFAPSVRQVTAAEVAKMTSQLPKSVERVGVFPAWSAEAIMAAATEAGLDTVQLHGGLDLDLHRELHQRFAGTLRIIQVVHWVIDGEDSDASGRIVREQLSQIANSTGGKAGIADRVLVDSKIGSATGGTGVTFDWATARTYLGNVPGQKIILAGGLKPENIAAAIERLDPWGLDVSSGVEARAGKKDPDKLALFLQNARSLRERPSQPGPDAEGGRHAW